MPDSDQCRLCGDRHLSLYHHDSRRPYQVCETCQLVQVPPAWFLDAEQERAEYDRHDNRVEDTGYQRFLQRSADQVRAHMAAPASGLDYGCGPAPALAAMLEASGYKVALYDWFYRRDDGVWQADYDFITATEVVEHLHDPRHWLEQLWSCLRPGGILVIQTKRVLSQLHFSEWHYTRDPTHVAFFSIATLYWLAQRWGARVRLAAPDVAVFHKQNGA